MPYRVPEVFTPDIVIAGSSILIQGIKHAATNNIIPDTVKINERFMAAKVNERYRIEALIS